MVQIEAIEKDDLLPRAGCMINAMAGEKMGVVGRTGSESRRWRYSSAYLRLVDSEFHSVPLCLSRVVCLFKS